MKNIDYYYDIIYRIKWNQDKNTLIWLNKELFNSHMIQLKNLAVSFNGDLITKFEDLNYFKIIKKNYKFLKDWEYYIEEPQNIDNFWRTFIDLPTLWNLWIWTDDDVTNKLLFDYWITWEDYYKKWKVILEYNENWNSYLYVDSHKITLEEWTKWLELFRLVFTAKNFYKSNTIIYSNLKKVFDDSWVTFKHLKKFELSQSEINSFLWKKLKTIQDKIWMKEKCLDINSAYITIWQQKA